jgi:hypothetical protein
MGSMLFMTLLSCALVFVQRMCQSDKVSMGSVVSRRNAVEPQDMIGCVANTVVY